MGDYHSRSKFTWSFSGYRTGEEAQKSLESMKAWFGGTFDETEWELTSSTYETPYGYAASISAQRQGEVVSEAPKDDHKAAVAKIVEELKKGGDSFD